MVALTRREFSLAAAALALVPGTAFALNEKQARVLVEGLVGEINKAIDSGKSRKALFGDFERIFRKYGDLSYIAAYAMGADGRRASKSQKKAFSNAFAGYLARNYGSRFNEFKGGRIEVESVKKVKRHYEVKTKAYLRGQSPFDVRFQVSDRSGKNLFFNMYIEGVNLLLTERTEIGAMLDRNNGDIDAMIRDLKKAKA
jgi:phospholipid transport system substrate-binding protein